MKNIFQVKIITTLWVLLVVLPTVIFITNYNPEDKFQVKVFKVGDGFGYDIIANNVIIIKQENMPAIQQQKNFISYEHAHKVASAVVEKLYKGDNPGVSMEELKSLGILSALDY